MHIYERHRYYPRESLKFCCLHLSDVYFVILILTVNASNNKNMVRTLYASVNCCETAPSTVFKGTILTEPHIRRNHISGGQPVPTRPVMRRWTVVLESNKGLISHSNVSVYIYIFIAIHV